LGGRTIAIHRATSRLAAALLAALVAAPAPSALAAEAVAPATAMTPLASVPDSTYVMNGPVHTVLRSGDTVYVGGRFDRVGPRTGPAVEVGLDGAQTPGLPEVAGSGPTTTNGAGGWVDAVVADGSGGWYVGGLFSRVGGARRTNLAHIRADRTVDPAFAPQLDDSIDTMVLSGSTLYVAGAFTTVAGQQRNRLAAIDVTTGSVTAFNPDADGPVHALAVSADASTVYVGGRFTRVGGLPRVALAALKATDGSAVPTFNVPVTGTLGTGNVQALAVSGTTMFVGGSFTSVGGQARTNLAAVTAGGPTDGTVVAGFDPKPSQGTCTGCASVYALTASGPTVYVGGLFTVIGGQPRTHLAALNATDGTPTAFDPAPNGNVRSVVVSGSTLLVGGTFRSTDGTASIGGQPRNYAAALRLTDGAATPFHPNPNNLVQSVAVSGSAVFLGGYFSSLGGVTRNGLAALSAIDGTVTGFDPQIGGVNGGIPAVYTLAASGPTIYLGGFFQKVGGQTRGSLAAVDATTGAVSSWNPPALNGSGAGVVETLAIADGVVYVGGAFTSVAGQPRNCLAAVRAVEGTATAWNPAPNSVVQVVRVDGDLVYAGGYFTTIAGQTRNKAAALRAADGTATSWHPDATNNGNVLALAVTADAVYLGGNFPSIHGIPRTNLAAVNRTDGAPTEFNPIADGGVHALAVDGDVVYAAGFFSHLGGAERHLIGAVRGSDGTVTGFDPHASPGFGAYALTLADDRTLYAGGSWLTLDSANQQGVAAFRPMPDLEPVVPEGSPWMLLVSGVALAGAVTSAHRRRRRSV
jgi:hypothetical protein